MRHREIARSKAIESIYAAAASPELWPDALASVCDAVGADGGLIAYHPRSTQGFLVTGRLREDLRKLYVEQYTINPFTLAALQMPRAQAFLANAGVEMDSVRRTSFFADILEPQRIEGIIQTVHSSLSGGGGVGGFGFTLNARQLDAAEAVQRRLQPLVSHLGRALDISLTIGRRLANSPVLTDAIAAMPGAALLLNEEGKVTFANVAAECLLAEGDGLTVRRTEGMRMSAEEGQEDAVLAKAIRSSLHVANGIDAGWIGSVRVSRPSGRPALLVLLTPLLTRFHAFGPALSQRACVLVQVLGGPILPLARAAAFGKLYGLTEAETRVAGLIGSGHTAPRVAALLAVSLPTVKTHLSHCFDKTGVRSQIELARLMALLPDHISSPG